MPPHVQEMKKMQKIENKFDKGGCGLCIMTGVSFKRAQVLRPEANNTKKRHAYSTLVVRARYCHD